MNSDYELDLAVYKIIISGQIDFLIQYLAGYISIIISQIIVAFCVLAGYNRIIYNSSPLRSQRSLRKNGVCFEKHNWQGK